MSTSIEAFRGFYARRIAAMAGTPQVDDRLVRAFEAVPREQFLEKGPRTASTGAGYIKTPTDNPAFLYPDTSRRCREKGPRDVHSLRRGSRRTKPVDASCWFAGDGWWLSTF